MLRIFVISGVPNFLLRFYCNLDMNCVFATTVEAIEEYVQRKHIAGRWKILKYDFSQASIILQMKKYEWDESILQCRYAVRYCNHLSFSG